MADLKDVLAWANDVCSTALTEARSGDPALANRIGANSSFSMFFNNVHGIKSVSADAFPAYYPGHWKEITRLYEDYQRDLKLDASTDEVSKLSESLTELKALVEAQAAELAALKESKTPAAPKKKSAKVEPEAEDLTDAEAETDAESEA